jgi:hypothetical protein
MLTMIWFRSTPWPATAFGLVGDASFDIGTTFGLLGMTHVYLCLGHAAPLNSGMVGRHACYLMQQARCMGALVNRLPMNEGGPRRRVEKCARRLSDRP